MTTTATATDIDRWRRNLQGEVDGALLYRAMAANAGDDRLAELYGRMADSEERHAALWRDRLTAAGAAATIHPTIRARVLAWLARTAGASVVAPIVAGQERSGRTMYDDQPEAAGTSLPADERSHARLLRTITGGTSGAVLARFEGRHRAVGGNALRAAVLGANDGLVSNFSLVMGVAGASAGGAPVLVAGLAGLLAGSLSMALGEWLSVQSARELYENQIATEADELAMFPDEEEEELRLIYEAKGLDPERARDLAKRVIEGDPATALDTMSREELGIDPHELGGSAWVAAGTSFVLFAAGAIVPVIPFLVGAGTAAIIASAVLSGVALFALGAAITLLTGRHPLFAGLRQVGFGMAAAAITFAIGTLLGTAIS
ncbi:MAG TPA: VIT1/CCC1 transporter family protein [Candidatus Limnocylindrales bacterium]|nr:VIT1/CCC1 transporter family protein [Candidatus Limnocylindrales bacterium]